MILTIADTWVAVIIAQVTDVMRISTPASLLVTAIILIQPLSILVLAAT